jgi:hypothetical protein
VAVPINPGDAWVVGGLCGGEPVECVIGVGDLLAAQDIRLRRDFAVVLRGGVGVLNIERARHGDPRQLEHRIIGAGFVQNTAERQHFVRHAASEFSEVGVPELGRDYVATMLRRPLVLKGLNM